MKRRLFKLVVFLLLGAIINVAVAWGCELSRSSLLPCGYFAYQIEPGKWATVLIKRTFGAARITGYFIAAEPRPPKPDAELELISKPYWSRPLSWVEPRLQADDIWFEEARGWPLISLRWSFRHAVSTDFFVDPDDPAIVLKGHVRARVDELRALPLLPVTFGFVINTVLYAVILWTLTLGPFTARRIIRRKRGHCIKCGYDLRGAEHEVCPECGWQM